MHYETRNLKPIVWLSGLRIRLRYATRHWTSEQMLLGGGSLIAAVFAGIFLTFLSSAGPQRAPLAAGQATGMFLSKGEITVTSSLKESAQIFHKGGLKRWLSVFTSGKLPDVIEDSDVEQYAKAFSAARNGDKAALASSIESINNPLLLGHVEAVRLEARGANATLPSISAWLTQYPDHPQHSALVRRLKKRDATAVSRLISRDAWSAGSQSGRFSSFGSIHASLLDWSGRPEAAALWKTMERLVQSNKLDDAETLLGSEKLHKNFRPLEMDLAAWTVAHHLLMQGEVERAFALSRPAALRSGPRLPGLLWTAGMSAWRANVTEAAAQFFAAHAQSSAITSWDAAAGGYWAYRSLMLLERADEARAFLELAARNPNTFYGILARQELGLTLDQAMETPDDKGLEAKTLAMPAVQRALALQRVGETTLANAELSYLTAQLESGKSNNASAIRAIADKLDLALSPESFTLAEDEGATIRAGEVNFADYKTPQWKPVRGFQLDPALIFSLVRKESGFNPQARSPQGAVGLMQLLPSTATYVARQASMSIGDQDLTDPATNLALGQAYLQYLLRKPEINNNLFFLAAAYNAGPGSLSKWLSNIDFQNDPLLFVESIPSRETRNYVEQVMAYYWIYKAKNGQTPDSLEDVINGKWPEYTPKNQVMAAL